MAPIPDRPDDSFGRGAGVRGEEARVAQATALVVVNGTRSARRVRNEEKKALNSPKL